MTDNKPKGKEKESKGAPHIKEKFEKKKEETQFQLEKEQKENEGKYKNFDDALKKWEAARDDRMKNFVSNRGDEKVKGDAAVRRRARTVAAPLPGYQPPLPTVSAPSSSASSSSSTAAVVVKTPAERKKKKREIVPPERPCPNVPMPPSNRLDVNDIFGPDGKPNCQLLKDHFLREGKLSNEAAIKIIEKVKPHYRKEPNLLELEAPLCVVGDIHGQYYDMIHLMETAGDPADTQYLFLGDYVDRGSFGCEVTLLLFAYKICNPLSFFMLRGNHESRLLTTHFNFKLECYFKYNAQVYDAFMQAFDCLPIAAVLNNTQGSFFCTHGGLSPEIQQLEEIESIKRFVEPPEKGPLCDLLWSDPIEDSTAVGLSDEDMEEWYDVDYVPNPTRGCGCVFGYAAVLTFLENNNLVCLIRAHEVQKEGYFCHYFWKSELDFPLVITIFSAPNYCDVYGNMAGFIRFSEAAFEFQQVGWVEHPFWLPNFMNAITYSLPYGLEAFTKLCAYILEGCMLNEEGDEELTLTEDERMKQKIQSFGKLGALIQKIRERQEEIVAGTVSLGDEVTKFEAAHISDAKNEHRPLHAQASRRSRSRTM